MYGNCITILNDHNMEIVCLQFDKMSKLYWHQWTTKLSNLESEQEIFQLEGEVMHHLDGDKILTSSFDKIVKI